jgi:hypothetical protein
MVVTRSGIRFFNSSPITPPHSTAAVFTRVPIISFTNKLQKYQFFTTKTRLSLFID